MSSANQVEPRDGPEFDIADQHGSPAKQKFKRVAQTGIRFAHSIVAKRQLQNRISLYFHQLDLEHWQEFATCIRYFRDRGYRSVTVPQFIAARPDDRCLLVSFDDNFRNWHDALGLFRDLGMTSTFYVNTLPFRDSAERPVIERYLRRLRMRPHYQTLTRDELREIRANGHSIGCHSHSHFILSSLPRELWDEEIFGSKRELERILGEPVNDFSWPYGMRRHFSDDLRRYCASIGFTTIANAIPGCQIVAGRDALNLYRTGWRLGASLEHNLANIRIDGRHYARLFGGSVIG